jgi:hypothetical protein
VVYLSKQFYSVAKGWPPCLCAVTATALLVSEAEKLALGGKITVQVPHSVVTLMEYKGQYWLTNINMVRYQSMLCENSQVKLEVVQTLNPATLLPLGAGPPDHDCVDVMNEVFSSLPDLCDQPLAQPNLKLFTDGSSFFKERVRHAGYAVVTLDSVLEVQALALDTSAQKAVLISLTCTLHLAAKRTVSIYTDSKYAFTTLHVHGAIYFKNYFRRQRHKIWVRDS